MASTTATATAAVLPVESKAYELSGAELHLALPNMRGVLEDIEKGRKFIENATVLDTGCWNWLFVFAEYPRTSRMLREELGNKEEPLYLGRVATLNEQSMLASLFAEDVAARIEDIRRLINAPKRVCGVALDAKLSATECARTVEARRVAAQRAYVANEERIRTVYEERDAERKAEEVRRVAAARECETYEERIRVLAQELAVRRAAAEGARVANEERISALTKELVAARNMEEKIGWQIEDLDKASRLATRVEAASIVLEEEAGEVVEIAKATAQKRKEYPRQLHHCDYYCYHHDNSMRAAAAVEVGEEEDADSSSKRRRED